MYAVNLSGHGGPEVMTWGRAPDPIPGPGEVLIDVAAAGVNRADVLQRRGQYPPPPGGGPILGLECSGTIAGLGPGVSGWKPGEPVCALLTGGGYAQQVAVPATQVLPIPETVDLVTAAALPEVACTVWSNVVMTARLRAGQLLLVHGGGGGIGTHAIQVGAALGATVAVTAGSAQKLHRCLELGARIAVNYREKDFVAAVHDNGRAGADVILDNMGAAYLSRNIDALAPDGQLVVIGMQGGVTSEVNLGVIMAKRATIHATTLRARPVAGPSSKAEIVANVREHLWPMIADGTVKPVVHERVPVTEASRAHTLLDAEQTVGKIVLVM